MSYPRDLDDYSEEELRKELDRRAQARAQGVCDYCGRGPRTTPCRYEERHKITKTKSSAPVAQR